MVGVGADGGDVRVAAASQVADVELGVVVGLELVVLLPEPVEPGRDLDDGAERAAHGDDAEIAGLHRCRSGHVFFAFLCSWTSS